MTNYAEMTEEQIILRELEVTAREADLLRRLRESKLPRRAACIKGDELRRTQPQRAEMARKNRAQAKTNADKKQPRSDGKVVCQFPNCNFSVANEFNMSAKGKSAAIGKHHRAEHADEMREFILDELTSGTEMLDLYKLMDAKHWCAQSTARTWVEELLQEL